MPCDVHWRLRLDDTVEHAAWVAREFGAGDGLNGGPRYSEIHNLCILRIFSEYGTAQNVPAL
jgi:hypothetical protein